MSLYFRDLRRLAYRPRWRHLSKATYALERIWYMKQPEPDSGYWASRSNSWNPFELFPLCSAAVLVRWLGLRIITNMRNIQEEGWPKPKEVIVILWSLDPPKKRTFMWVCNFEMSCGRNASPFLSRADISRSSDSLSIFKIWHILPNFSSQIFFVASSVQQASQLVYLHISGSTPHL